MYQDLGGAHLRGRLSWSARRTRTAPAAGGRSPPSRAGYLKHGVGLLVVDVVTSRQANLHAELFDTLEVKSRGSRWESGTGLYAVGYRPVTVRNKPQLEVWPASLAVGERLPEMPLWLGLDLCVPRALGGELRHHVPVAADFGLIACGKPSSRPRLDRPIHAHDPGQPDEADLLRR